MSTLTDTPSEQDAGARPARVGRVLTVVAAVSFLFAATLATLAVTRSSNSDVIVTEVTDVRSETLPSTVPPVQEPPTTTIPAPITDGETVTGAETGQSESPVIDVDDGLSELADLLGPAYSVIPEPLTPRPAPVGLATSTIGVDGFPIRPIGLEDDGQLEIPDETEIGWYRYGATAGRPGATVLAAHVSWNGTTGPFFELGSMEPGDEITVTLDDETQRQYLVTERTMYDKNELPRERIWRNSGDEQLVLITCGGDFNPEIRRYRQNIVVYASPVG